MHSMLIDDLAEQWDDSVIPTTETDPQTEMQHRWAEQGAVIIPRLVDERLMAAYEDEWLEAHGGYAPVPGDPSSYASPMGWRYATPYMDFPALRELVCCWPIAEVVSELIGEPAGVHLNLTGWQSTQRDWHFDQYLNQPHVGAFYVAVWIALDEISVDAGPFEYFPGSHRWWPPISQERMRIALGGDGDGPDWPKHSERILTPLFEAEIEERGLSPHRFLAQRGDVLFWHSRLLHRGSVPIDPQLERRGLIAHYSGINHRPDMPPAKQHGDGWYFPLNGQPW